MTSTRHPWFVTADGRRAILFRCSRTDGGALHVDETLALDNAHEGEHEHGRPTMLGGSERRSATASGSRAAPHLGAQGHDTDETLRRFAREIRTWLADAVRRFGIESLNLFAPPRLLGLLRADLQGVGAPVEVHEGELTHLRPAELASHPAIRNAAGAGSGARR